MKQYAVQLSSINDVKAFVNAATACRCDIDLVSGRYIVDAKSIMGIFSLDLSKPIKIEIHGTDEEAAGFIEATKVFVAE